MTPSGEGDSPAYYGVTVGLNRDPDGPRHLVALYANDFPESQHEIARLEFRTGSTEVYAQIGDRWAIRAERI